jgi:hypothetical protein
MFGGRFCQERRLDSPVEPIEFIDGTAGSGRISRNKAPIIARSNAVVAKAGRGLE